MSDFSIKALLLTLLIYGAFPMSFAYLRKTPITKKRFFLYSFSVNFFLMVILIAIAVYTDQDQKAIPNGFPYFLWTTVFSNTGIGVMTKKNLIIYPEGKTPVHNVVYYNPTGKGADSPNDAPVQNVEIPVYWVGQNGEPNTTNTATQSRQIKRAFCENCGTRLPEGSVKFCPKCGQMIPDRH